MRLFCIVISFLFIQKLDGQVNLSSRVVDANSRSPLSYAHVINLKDYSGTITNSKGEFNLKCSLEDTIRFQFIGYRDYEATAAELIHLQNIELLEDAELVEQITIVSDDGFLYDLVSSCRKKLSRQNQNKNAKAYLNIISETDNRPLEFIEAYYNADIEKGSVTDIKYKNGKSYLMTHEQGGYFFNVNISKALTMYSLLKGHAIFPINPLQLKRRKLRKKFKLSLESRTKERIVVAFEPRSDNSKFFSGKIWIHPKSHSIQAIELNSNGDGKKVFVGIGNSRIEEINYSLTFSFVEKENSSELSLVKLKYNAILGTAVDLTRLLKVRTESILHLFDYNSSYILPYFDYHPQVWDYRLFTVVPSDTKLWTVLENDNQIKLSDSKRAIENKMKSQGTLFSDNLPTKDRFFERNFLLWSDTTRVVLKLKKNTNADRTPLSRVGKISVDNLKKSPYAVDKLKVEIQLYLDMTKSDNGMLYRTATLFDSYKSYNELEESDNVECYVNICFDLAEIHRRKLENRISVSDKSHQTIKRLYKEISLELQKDLRAFRKAAFAGRPMLELHIWNKRIRLELGIDNIAHSFNDNIDGF